MKKVLSSLIAGGLLMLSALTIAHAQQEEQWWLVREEVIRPERLLDFVAGVGEQFAEAAKHKIPFADITAWGSNDFHYFFAIPIKGWDSVDDLSLAWSKFHTELEQKMGAEAYGRLMKKLDGTIEYDHYYVFVWRPDLSYYPAAPRLKAGERLFLNWQYWYIKFDMAAEAEAVTKEIAKLYKDRGVSESMEVSQGVAGADAPVYFTAYRGKDEADFFTHDPWRTLGKDKDYQALLARIFKTTRKMVRVNLELRPELSYHPEAVK